VLSTFVPHNSYWIPSWVSAIHLRASQLILDTVLSECYPPSWLTAHLGYRLEWVLSAFVPHSSSWTQSWVSALHLRASQLILDTVLSQCYPPSWLTAHLGHRLEWVLSTFVPHSSSWTQSWVSAIHLRASQLILDTVLSECSPPSCLTAHLGHRLESVLSAFVPHNSSWTPSWVSAIHLRASQLILDTVLSQCYPPSCLTTHLGYCLESVLSAFVPHNSSWIPSWVSALRVRASQIILDTTLSQCYPRSCLTTHLGYRLEWVLSAFVPHNSSWISSWVSAICFRASQLISDTVLSECYPPSCLTTHLGYRLESVLSAFVPHISSTKNPFWCYSTISSDWQVNVFQEVSSPKCCMNFCECCINRSTIFTRSSSHKQHQYFKFFSFVF
jgi:hypothetical protein